MARRTSNDLRARVPVLFFEQGYKVKYIVQLLGIKKTLIYDILNNFHKYQVPFNPHAFPLSGRPRRLSRKDIQFIKSLLDRRHSLYLDELQAELYFARGTIASIPTITRTLRRLLITRKAVSARAAERNEVLRAIYMNRIADLVTDPAMLMFTDESSRDRRTSGRRWGWSLKGTKSLTRRFFVRGDRYSLLPVLTIDGLVTWDIFDGSVTSERFVAFLREMVIPLTNPYPGPRSVLVLDNCNIHHAEEVRELVEDEAGCKLVFLPPYSPDLNPIEQAFAIIKAFLRRHHNDFSVEGCRVNDNQH